MKYDIDEIKFITNKKRLLKEYKQIKHEDKEINKITKCLNNLIKYRAKHGFDFCVRCGVLLSRRQIDIIENYYKNKGYDINIEFDFWSNHTIKIKWEK